MKGNPAVLKNGNYTYGKAEKGEYREETTPVDFFGVSPLGVGVSLAERINFFSLPSFALTAGLRGALEITPP